MTVSHFSLWFLDISALTTVSYKWYDAIIMSNCCNCMFICVWEGWRNKATSHHITSSIESWNTHPFTFFLGKPHSYHVNVQFCMKERLHEGETRIPYLGKTTAVRHWRWRLLAVQHFGLTRDIALTGHQSLNRGCAETYVKFLSVSSEVRSCFKGVLVFHAFYFYLQCQWLPFSTHRPQVLPNSFTSATSWKKRLFFSKGPWVQPMMPAEEGIPSA